MTTNTKKLSELQIGDIATIESLCTSHIELRIKLQTFGLLKGTTVEVKSVAPFGDPITILVRGFSLSLRRGEADAVLVNTSLENIIPKADAPLVPNTLLS